MDVAISHYPSLYATYVLLGTLLTNGGKEFLYRICYFLNQILEKDKLWDKY